MDLVKDKFKIEGMLKNYIILKSEVKNIELDIEELENDYIGIGAIGYSEKTGETYKFNSIVENEVVSKDKKLENLKRIKHIKEIQIQRVDNALAVLNDKEYRIIELKYFSERKKSWTNVSRKMDMCEAWCRELKERAITKMVPIIFPIQDNSEKIAK